MYSGWHLCSNCGKNASYMCYTCTYSLCKTCIRDGSIACIRKKKGFCRTCMKTITMIEDDLKGDDDMVRVHSIWFHCHDSFSGKSVCSLLLALMLYVFVRTVKNGKINMFLSFYLCLILIEIRWILVFMMCHGFLFTCLTVRLALGFVSL